jgi:hypothetical protein
MRCQDLQGNLVQAIIKDPQILALILLKPPSLVVSLSKKDARSRLMKKRTSERRKPKSSRRVQYAALPYRTKGKSQLEIMLVTSRGTRRWIIPKGWPKRGKPPYDTAAKEAFEEAGVIGKVRKRPIGSYPYDKILGEGV